MTLGRIQHLIKCLLDECNIGSKTRMTFYWMTFHWMAYHWSTFAQIQYFMTFSLLPMDSRHDLAKIDSNKLVSLGKTTLQPLAVTGFQPLASRSFCKRAKEHLTLLALGQPKAGNQWQPKARELLSPNYLIVKERKSKSLFLCMASQRLETSDSQRLASGFPQTIQLVGVYSIVAKTWRLSMGVDWKS